MAIPKLLWLNRLLDPLASRPLSDQRRRCPLAPSLRRPLPPSQRRLSPRCCSLQLFPRQVSKPLLIRFGDVRVEADSQLLSKQDGSASGTPAAVPVTENSGNSFGRFLHLIQYCGFSVTSVQLVLLEAIPDCMLHVTVDELSAEAFRSREGCQLELSCRLAQGKILRRRDASERLLANFAFSLQLSIDVTSGGLNRLGLRLADPSINLYRGILDVIQEFLERWLRLLQKKHDRCWPRGSRDWRMPQFLSTIARSSTRVSRTIKGEVSPSELLMSMFRRKTASVRSRSSVSPSPIAEITETSVNSAEIKLCSETVTTSVLLQDVVWWKLHFTEAASCLKSTLKKTSPGRRRSEDEVSITWVVELDSVQCNFSDSDAFRWTVSVRLLTFSKFQNAKEWEFGAESLLIVDPESNPGPASYEHHRWGHTIYIGVAIVQYIPDLLEPSVYVCVDDFKAEWSDKSLSGREASSLICTAKEATFLLFMTEELAFERCGTTDFVCSARSTRIWMSSVTAIGIRPADLLNAQRIPPLAAKEVDEAAVRFWSQVENDKKKMEMRREHEEKRNRVIKLIGEASLFCVSLESGISVVTRDVTISSNASIYFCWSPLIHRVLYRLISFVKNAFTSPKSSEAVRMPPRILQWKVLTNHSVELDMDLPRHHRMV